MRIGHDEAIRCRYARLEGLSSTMTRYLVILLLAIIFIIKDSRAEEDPRDAAVIDSMIKQTLEFERTGTDLKWSNPETGSRGVIRVERTYYRDANTPCRDYVRTTKRPEGEDITTRGTGCRMGDGRWFLNEGLGDPAPKAPPTAARPPAERKHKTAAPPSSPKTEAPAVPPPAGTGDALEPDAPDEDEMAEVGAPTPPRVKPKVMAPDYTMPSKSAL